MKAASCLIFSILVIVISVDKVTCQEPSGYDPLIHDPAGYDPSIHDPAIHEPILDISIDHIDQTSLNFTWEISGYSDSVKKYRARIRNSNQNGRAVLERLFSTNESKFFIIDGVQANSVYYIELEALSEDDAVLLTAGTLYVMPSHGKLNSIVRASSITTPIRSIVPSPPTNPRTPLTPPTFPHTPPPIPINPQTPALPKLQPTPPPIRTPQPTPVYPTHPQITTSEMDKALSTPKNPHAPGQNLPSHNVDLETPPIPFTDEQITSRVTTTQKSPVDQSHSQTSIFKWSKVSSSSHQPQIPTKDPSTPNADTDIHLNPSIGLKTTPPSLEDQQNNTGEKYSQTSTSSRSKSSTRYKDSTAALSTLPPTKTTKDDSVDNGNYGDAAGSLQTSVLVMAGVSLHWIIRHFV